VENLPGAPLAAEQRDFVSTQRSAQRKKISFGEAGHALRRTGMWRIEFSIEIKFGIPKKARKE
jgi:hypothetical protein